MWQAQVLSALRGAQAEHFIDPTTRPPEKYLAPKGDKKTDDEPPVVNPEYEKWVAKDQQVLSYLLTSLFARDRLAGHHGDHSGVGLGCHRNAARVLVKGEGHQHQDGTRHRIQGRDVCK